MCKFLPVMGVAVLVLFQSACEQSAPKAPVIGEAYVGPAKLEIHGEIAPKSPVVATGTYGEKLQIIGKRRLFLKVRTGQGIEGWVDQRNLVDAGTIVALQELAKNSLKYPSQGQATTYDTLNVHTEPNRSSPSYLQIAPGERVDVIGHSIAPRKGAPRKPLVIASPAQKKVSHEKKPPKSKAVPPPPLPPPPKPPSDWLELSRQFDPDEPPEPVKPAPAPLPAETVRPDDWTLVRKSTGQAGWVLSRRLYLAVPDEVAQYAEGKRITSYFSLGKEGGKDVWLWTTLEPGPQDHEIDGFRVFFWNTRHKRYETSFIQRRVRGFYPVLVNGPSFSILLEEDGKRVRQRYTLVDTKVKFEGVEP